MDQAQQGGKTSRGKAQRVCFAPGIDIHALDDASRRMGVSGAPTRGHQACCWR
ncbi:hypothetical protein [Uliginosibacterium sp. H1]|uniref:hypothetical protein n=1 Tax=Uliginosibacterium sp. H1 TaxID=3114757 RepID=UPI002E19174A|nr:hypothetical protein [Uliginosibacterium sp. H1]